jgi:hypothetical protein
MLVRPQPTKPDNRNKSKSTRMGIRKEKTMTWQEITTEIVSDVAQITSASPETESVIGTIQWQAKILAGLIFQQNIPSLTFQDGHTPQDGHSAVNVVGLSILPDPTTAPEHWRRTDLNAVPKKNGVRYGRERTSDVFGVFEAECRAWGGLPGAIHWWAHSMDG